MPKIRKVHSLPDTSVEGEIYILKKNKLNNVTAYIGTKDNSFRSVSTTEAKNIFIKHQDFPDCNTLEDILVDLSDKLSFDDTKEFIKFWSGSLKDYQKIDFPDQNTLYFIYAPTGIVINTALSDTPSFKMPIYSNSGSTMDLLVNWGDGTIDRITYGNKDYLGSSAEYNGTWFKDTNPIHTYENNGIYTINIDGYCPYLSFYDAYTEEERQIYPKMLIEVASLDNIGLMSLDRIFYNCENLESMCSLPNNFDFTSMDYSFYNCKQLISIKDLPTSLVSMNYTFYGCKMFNSRIIIPEKVIELPHTFENCENLTIFPSILGEVANLEYTFANCGFENISVYTIPYNVTDAKGAFKNCSRLTNTPILNIGLINAEEMFMGCANLISITNFSSTIENAKRMFMGCTSLENQIPDFPSYVKDISEMYANCINLKGNVPYFPKSVEKCKKTFYACFNLDGYAEDNWTMINPKLTAKTDGQYNCYQCFLGCNNLKNYYSDYVLDGKTYPKIWEGAISEYEDNKVGWCGNSEPIIIFEVYCEKFQYTCKRDPSKATVIINWGDGVEEIPKKDWPLYHTYDKEGKYIVTIREENRTSPCKNDGLICAGQFQGVPQIKKIYSLNLLYMYNCLDAFYLCGELTYIHGNVFNNEWLEKQNYSDDNFGTRMFGSCTNLLEAEIVLPRKCESFGNMFNNCTKLHKITKLIPNTAYNTRYMFYNCTSLVDYPSFELGGTKPANYTYMFSQTGGSVMSLGSIKHIVIPKNVENCRDMFSRCQRILDTCSFEMGYINNKNGNMIRLDCTGMFYQCGSIIDSSNCIFPSRTQGTRDCFAHCGGMKFISNGFENNELYDYDEINIQQNGYVKTLAQMFYNCRNLNDVSNFTLPKNRWFDLSGMFYNCRNLQIGPKMHEKCYPKYMNQLLFNCVNLTTCSFDTVPTSAIDYKQILSECHKLVKVPFFRENTFDLCYEIGEKYYNYKNLNFEINCHSIYSGCKSITGFIEQDHELLLPLNANYNYAFNNCFSFEKALPFNLTDNYHYYTSCVEMYKNCISLVDISNIIIPKSVSNLSYMFWYDSNYCNQDKGRMTFPTFESDTLIANNVSAEGMFYRNFKKCNNISIPENFQFPKGVTNLASAFRECDGIRDASNLVIKSCVINCANTFRNCIKLQFLPKFEITVNGGNCNCTYMFSGISSQSPETSINLDIVIPRRVSDCTYMFSDIDKNIDKMPIFDIDNYASVTCSLYGFMYRSSYGVNYKIINDDFIISKKVSNLDKAFTGFVFAEGKKVINSPDPEGNLKFSYGILNDAFRSFGDYYWSTYDLDYLGANTTAGIISMQYTFATGNEQNGQTRTIHLMEGNKISLITIPKQVVNLTSTFSGCVSNVPLSERRLFEIPDDSKMKIFKNICKKDKMSDMFGLNIDLSILNKCRYLTEIEVHDINVINIDINHDAPIKIINISNCGFSHDVLNNFLLSLPTSTNAPTINLTGYEDTIGLEEETLEFVKNQGWTIIN